MPPPVTPDEAVVEARDESLPHGLCGRLSAMGDKPTQLETAVPRKLFERSDSQGLMRLVPHLAVLLVGCIGLQLSGAGCADLSYWVLALVIGIPGVFLFAPLHECIHRTAFARAWLNNVVSHGCGFVLMLPAGYFRAFHLEHHRSTQDPVRDPELVAGPPRSLRSYLWRLSGLAYWIERVSTILRHASGCVPEVYVSQAGRAAAVIEARIYLLAYVAVAAAATLAGSDLIVRCWIVPVVIAQPFLRAFLMAEHGSMPLVPDMLANSRTTRSNWLVRWLAWNMPYHAEHHYQAAVPFHALPSLREWLAERAPASSASYVGLHWQWVTGFCRSGSVRSASG